MNEVSFDELVGMAVSFINIADLQLIITFDRIVMSI